MRKHHRLLIVVLVLLALGAVWRLAHGAEPAGQPARTPPPPAAAHGPFPPPVQYAPPEYPRAARDAGVQGTVWVQVLINQAGRVLDAKVSRGIPGLDAAALACVRRWIFATRMQDGRPSPSAFEVPVRFALYGYGDPPRDAQPPSGPPPARKLIDDDPTIAPYPDPRGTGVAPGGDAVIDEMPTAVHRVAPRRTAAMRRRDWKGTVVVQALVDSLGRVLDARVSPSMAGLDSSAIAAVKQWRFKPARSNGRAVEAWVAVPVRF